MNLDRFCVHTFAQFQIFRDFQMMLDGFFVHCFAECVFSRISKCFEMDLSYTLLQIFPLC